MVLKRVVWGLLALCLILFYLALGSFVWNNLPSWPSSAPLRGCENLSPADCTAFAQEKN